MKQNARILIVDDEQLARQRIKSLLDPVDGIEIAGECSNGRQAVKSILKLQPDLVFLDIQMPELNGFEVIQTIGQKDMPVVIFVTAYDQYALRAFEVHAVDYLLKPYDQKRFMVALRNALRELSLRRNSNISDNVDSLISSMLAERRILDRILVKSGGRISIIETDQVDWVESAGNYVTLHVGNEKHMIRETMKNMENRLSSDTFTRIHRTVIVNINRIQEIKTHFQGDYAVILQDGSSLPLSRRYRELLIKSLGEI